MKTSKKIIVLTLSSLFVSAAIAQTPIQAPKNNVTTTTTVKTNVSNNVGTNLTNNSVLQNAPNINTLTAKETGNTTLGTATLATTNLPAPNAGNTYERETTPLLRRIAQKKAMLMEKKLDTELENAEAERLKAQHQKNNPLDTKNNANTADVGVNTNPRIIDVSSTANNPLQMPPVAEAPKKARTKAMEEDYSMMPTSDVRVLMTYGFDDNLFAKITSGNQGGYVVNKGDILPDGRQVLGVYSNYIEVKFPAKKAPVQKIYVGANSLVNNSTDGNSGNVGVGSSAGTASSANILPLMGPMSSSQMVGTSGNVEVQKARLPSNLPGLSR